MKLLFVGGGNMCQAIIGGLIATGTPTTDLHAIEPVALLDGVSLVAVPEPETLTLLGVGLLGVLLTRRQQRKCT